MCALVRLTPGAQTGALTRTDMSRNRFGFYSEIFTLQPNAIPGYSVYFVKQGAGWRPECANCGSTKAADMHGTLKADKTTRYRYGLS